MNKKQMNWLEFFLVVIVIVALFLAIGMVTQDLMIKVFHYLFQITGRLQ